jgi:hypothetical protein
VKSPIHVIAVVAGVTLAALIGFGSAFADRSSDAENVLAIAKKFGVVIGPVTEDIRRELNLRSTEEYGIKVGSVILEINKNRVRNLDDFGRLLSNALEKGHVTFCTREPTNPENMPLVLPCGSENDVPPPQSVIIPAN